MIIVLAGSCPAGFVLGQTSPQVVHRDPQSSLPVWFSNQFAEKDDRRAAIRNEIRQRFVRTKNATEAASLARPFLLNSKSSADAAYKAMVALYYRTVVTGAYTGRSDVLRLWPVFADKADRSSPEHARIFCDIAAITLVGQVRFETAIRTLQRFQKASDVAFLGSATADASHRARNIPGLEKTANILTTRAKTLNSTEIVDYVGKGDVAKSHLVFLAGTCYERAAWTTQQSRYGRSAIELFGQVADSAGAPAELRRKAEEAKKAMLQRGFMR